MNSVKSQKTADSIDNKYWKEYKDQMRALKMENMRLLQELLESQKSYQTLLQQALEEQRAQVNTLTHLCENIHKRAARQESGYEIVVSFSHSSRVFFFFLKFLHPVYEGCAWIIFCSYNSCIAGNTLEPQLASLAITETHCNTASECSDMTLDDWLRELKADETAISRVSIYNQYDISYTKLKYIIARFLIIFYLTLRLFVHVYVFDFAI